jgi:coenzyme F420 biosynthesis associated uncharacterized protein
VGDTALPDAGAGRTTHAVSDPIDWSTARRIGRSVAGRDPLARSYLGSSLERDFASVTEEAADLVAAATGLSAGSAVRAMVVDRGEWVDVNVGSMRHMLAPLVARIGERLASRPFASAGRAVAGAELGVLLGFLARRVLGQYDLLVLENELDGDLGPLGPAPAGDTVYYVGSTTEFRRWIAIHEVTHRAQFTGVPWMHSHFLSLVNELLSMVDPDPRSLIAAARRAADDLRSGHDPLRRGGLVGLFVTREQQLVLDRVQALMSLLEGHGNVVMDDLGARHVVGAERMSRVLAARRAQGGLTGLASRLFGLEMKMKQYETGERFVRGVLERAGARAFAAVWSSPGALPTLEELDRPERWLARIHGVGAGIAPDGL